MWKVGFDLLFILKSELTGDFDFVFRPFKTTIIGIIIIVIIIIIIVIIITITITITIMILIMIMIMIMIMIITIIIIIVSLTKFSIVIGSPRAYLSRNEKVQIGHL